MMRWVLLQCIVIVMMMMMMKTMVIGTYGVMGLTVCVMGFFFVSFALMIFLYF